MLRPCILAYKEHRGHDLLALSLPPTIMSGAGSGEVITQRRSVAKSVGCFQRRLFVGVFACQHANFRTSKHMMMKLGG